MNPKRLILAIIVAFVFVVATDFLIHGVWLKPTYAATASLWRTEPEMQARMGWMFASQFLAAMTFVVLWARGFAERACLRCALMYGLFMGLFSQAATIMTYVVTPVPAEIPLKWFFTALAQATLLGVVTFFVYRPKPAVPTAQA
ncbi:hypothetical protein LBMAG56_36800 [Verrucomicrobiota bacterium]|nr:hypothetical protein LBMAG56_36800 [Verrucomicrobiota bacterium]